MPSRYQIVEAAQMQSLYDTMSRWWTCIPPTLTPILFLIDAPFGRFTPNNQKSWLLVDGIKSWIFMELVSFIGFSYAFLKSPLSPARIGGPPPLSLSHPPTFLVSLYCIHYINRSLISPLRTPSRSKSHIAVPMFAVSYHLINGSLMGAYLSSDTAERFLDGAFDRPLFWLGVGMWAVGFVGNFVHDEILLDIRRKAKAKGKGKADGEKDGQGQREHYAIPNGYLYSLISYPNYFCEWMEWLGFALAAAPVPSFASFGSLLATLTPPYLFFLSEFFLMLPRAYKGHKWYHQRFPDYPKERKAVIPFVF